MASSGRSGIFIKYKIQKYFVKHKNICSLGPPSLNNKTSLSDAEDEEGWEEADTASRMAAVYQAQGDFQPKPVGDEKYVNMFHLI